MMPQLLIWDGLGNVFRQILGQIHVGISIEAMVKALRRASFHHGHKRSFELLGLLNELVGKDVPIAHELQSSLVSGEKGSSHAVGL